MNYARRYLAPRRRTLAIMFADIHDFTRISEQKLVSLEKRLLLREFVRQKLTEYNLDEIGIYLDDEELFTYLNPGLPLQEYRSIQPNLIKRAFLGEDLRVREPLGNGEMIRRGVSFNAPETGSVLVAAGKFIPQTLRPESPERGLHHPALPAPHDAEEPGADLLRDHEIC